MSRRHRKEGMLPRRAGHAAEGGLTLIELLVSVAILSIVGVAMGASMDAGIKALGVGGAGDRVAGARDLGSFEQNLGVDLTRASCIYVASTTATYGTSTGSTACTKGLPGPSGSACTGSGATSPCGCTQTGAVICMAWPHVADSTCHLAVYLNSSGSTNTVLRQEWTLSSGAWTSQATVRVDAAAVSVPVASAVPSSAPGGYSWPSSVRMSVSSSAVKVSAASGAVFVHPLVKNPASSVGYGLC